MYSDASYISPTRDAQRVVLSTPLLTQLPAAPRPGTGWRFMATVALLIVTLPVFLIAAVACLPVVLVVAAVRGLPEAVSLLRSSPRQSGFR